MKHDNKQSSWLKLQKLHVYYQSSGFYDLVGANLRKVLLTLALLVAVFLLVRPYVQIYQDELLILIQEKLSPVRVFSLFFVSESILGLIPPDLFMLWAKARFPETPYLMVGVLAGLSYLGGIVAYGMGRGIEHAPKIHATLSDRHAGHVQFIRKWGGVFILTAALLPIPYAIASTVAGLVKFPFKTYLLFGLARFLRFYIYAAAIFSWSKWL
ncbi:YqaA family protein [Litorivivens sp.]|uniref:YqaA family protein n=1 Tax=Litorivivens sp. TaxID=2020868 RepID=UPI0035639F6D